VYHVMAMVAPFLHKGAKALFEKLAQEYLKTKE
jgi:hypothetical protein